MQEAGKASGCFSMVGVGIGEVEAEGGEAGVEFAKESDLGVRGWGGEGDAEA